MESIGRRQKGRPHSRRQSNSNALMCTVCERILPLTFYSSLPKCKEQSTLTVTCSDETWEVVCLTCEKLSSKTVSPKEDCKKVPKTLNPSVAVEKPYQYVCQFCEKGFRMRHLLIEHERCHTGEKPFSCDVCTKTFRTRLNLRIHSSVHTGLKPYHCEVCGKDFRLSQFLSQHKRTHSGVKPHSCEICGIRFCARKSLYKHRKIHEA